MTFNVYIPLTQIQTHIKPRENRIKRHIYKTCPCATFFTLPQYLLVLSMEFSGMIPVITSNNHPIPPFPSIPYYNVGPPR